MFDRVTGFFRRFGGKKKKTSETAFLDEDDAGLDDFGLDDADFGDSVGTAELEGTPGEFDTGDDFGAMETFEAAGQETSLSGGSGENLLEDSLAGAETFETLGGSEDADLGGGDVNFDTPQPANRDFTSGGSEEDDFGDDFGELGGDFDSAGSSEVGADDFDLPQPSVSSAPAISVAKTAIVAVVALVIGLAISAFVLPMLSGKGAELDLKLGQGDAALQKAKRELKQYEGFGGIAALEREKVELDGLRGSQAAIEDAEAAAAVASEKRAAYDAVVTAKVEAETLTAEANTQREGLQVQLDAAEIHLNQQREIVAKAQVEHQQRQRMLEDSTVVADAFDAADQRYTNERTHALLHGGAGAGD